MEKKKTLQTQRFFFLLEMKKDNQQPKKPLKYFSFLLEIRCNVSNALLLDCVHTNLYAKGGNHKNRTLTATDT